MTQKQIIGWTQRFNRLIDEFSNATDKKWNEAINGLTPMDRKRSIRHYERMANIRDRLTHIRSSSRAIVWLDD